MLGDVRQGLLDQPVNGFIGRSGQELRVAGDQQLNRQPSLTPGVHKSGQRGNPGGGDLLLCAGRIERPHDSPQVSQRDTAGPHDFLECGACESRRILENGACRSGLDHHGTDAVRDDVMHVAGDAVALTDPHRSKPRFLLCAQLFHCQAQRAGDGPLPRHQVAGHCRSDHERKSDGGDGGRVETARPCGDGHARAQPAEHRDHQLAEMPRRRAPGCGRIESQGHREPSD